MLKWIAETESSEKVCCAAVSNLSHLEPITKHQYIDWSKCLSVCSVNTQLVRLCMFYLLESYQDFNLFLFNSLNHATVAFQPNISISPRLIWWLILHNSMLIIYFRCLFYYNTHSIAMYYYNAMQYIKNFPFIWFVLEPQIQIPLVHFRLEISSNWM